MSEQAIERAEQRRAADCLQRPLLRRSRFRQQLTPSVRRLVIFAATLSSFSRAINPTEFGLLPGIQVNGYA